MKMLSLLCSLVMVPITIDYLDTEHYGIWMAITSILYWFCFMDIGLGNGMRNYMAEAFARDDYEKASSYFSTAIILLTGIALVILLVALPVICLADLGRLFNTRIGGLTVVMTIAVVLSLVQFVAKNVGMVYIAMQRYAANDLIVFLGNITSVVIIFILTKTTTGNLSYVVTAALGAPTLLFLLAYIPLKRELPQLAVRVSAIDWGIARQIVGKGLGFFAIQITSCLVIFGSANVFISHYCGPEQVTVYNVSYKLFNLLIVAYTIFLSPLWNAYTDAYVKQDYAWLRSTFVRSLKMWGLSVLGGVALLAVSGWFFEKWVGDSVSIPFDVSACILVYVSAFNLNNCVTYLVNGLNKIRIQIVTSIVMTAAYLIAVLCIKGTWGIIGITLAMAGAYLLMATVHLYQCHLLLHGKARGIWDR